MRQNFDVRYQIKQNRSNIFFVRFHERTHVRVQPSSVFEMLVCRRRRHEKIFWGGSPSVLFSNELFFSSKLSNTTNHQHASRSLSLSLTTAFYRATRDNLHRSAPSLYTRRGGKLCSFPFSFSLPFLRERSAHIFYKSSPACSSSSSSSLKRVSMSLAMSFDHVLPYLFLGTPFRSTRNFSKFQKTSLFLNAALSNFQFSSAFFPFTSTFCIKIASSGYACSFANFNISSGVPGS